MRHGWLDVGVDARVGKSDRLSFPILAMSCCGFVVVATAQI
jgi:hypothetical protein